MGQKVWLNGSLVEKEQAVVSVWDHGVLYGDGVFEGIRQYAGRIFESQAHLRRLYESAKAIKLQIPYTPAELHEAMEQTTAANDFVECYLRLVVTRGVGALGINPATCGRPTVYIIAEKMHLYPQEYYEKGMSVITSTYVRTHPSSLSPRVKSLNYLNNILAKIEANDAGVPEAFMLNHQGNLSEATAVNVFVAKDGALRTPPPTDGALEGVTRRVVLDLCRDLGLPAAEATVQRHDLYIADECFVTGTGAEVAPVTRIDGRPVGDGKVGVLTRRLIEAFHKRVREAAESGRN